MSESGRMIYAQKQQNTIIQQGQKAGAPKGDF